MQKNYSFMSYLNQFHKTYIPVWEEIISLVQKNTYFVIPKLGNKKSIIQVIFSYTNKLVFFCYNKNQFLNLLLQKASNFNSILKNLLNIQTKQIKKKKVSKHGTYFFQFFSCNQNIIQKYTKNFLYTHQDIELEIAPFGKVFIRNSNILYKNSLFQWELTRQLNKIKLPNLLNTDKKQQKNFQMSKKSNQKRMERQFSLSLHKNQSQEQRQKKKIKDFSLKSKKQPIKDSSLKKIEFQRVEQKIRQRIKTQFSIKDNRQNRILRLKSEASSQKDTIIEQKLKKSYFPLKKDKDDDSKRKNRLIIENKKQKTLNLYETIQDNKSKKSSNYSRSLCKNSRASSKKMQLKLTPKKNQSTNFNLKASQLNKTSTYFKFNTNEKKPLKLNSIKKQQKGLHIQKPRDFLLQLGDDSERQIQNKKNLHQNLFKKSSKLLHQIQMQFPSRKNQVHSFFSEFISIYQERMQKSKNNVSKYQTFQKQSDKIKKLKDFPSIQEKIKNLQNSISFKSKFTQTKFTQYFFRVQKVKSRLQRFMKIDFVTTFINKGLITLNFDQIHESMKAICQVQSKHTNNSHKLQQQRLKIKKSLKIRELYFTLGEYLQFCLNYLCGGSLKNKTNLIYQVQVDNFKKTNEAIKAEVQKIKSLFDRIQKFIYTQCKFLSIQQFQKNTARKAINNFQQILFHSFQNETFTSTVRKYLDYVSFIDSPSYQKNILLMQNQLKEVDKKYQCSELKQKQILKVQGLLIDISPAKKKLQQQIRKYLIQIQMDYEHLYKNLESKIKKLIRSQIQITSDMLLEKTFLQMKNKYFNQINQLIFVFCFLLDRRFIFLGFYSKTLSEIFETLCERRQKLLFFISTFQHKVQIYRKKTQQQIKTLEVQSKQMKQKLKELSDKIKVLIKDIQNDKDILQNHLKIRQIQKDSQIYNFQHNSLVQRMQQNQMIYWEDDEFFQIHIRALLLSEEFIKTKEYKAVHYGFIRDIQWQNFFNFYQSFVLFKRKIQDTQISRIFDTSYELLSKNLEFIEIILYKKYTEEELERLFKLNINIKKENNSKFLSFLKTNSQINQIDYKKILQIYRESKLNQFQSQKINNLVSFEVTTEEQIYHFSSLKKFSLIKIKNYEQIYCHLVIFSDKNAQKLKNCLKLLLQVFQKLKYLKIMLAHINNIQQKEKQLIFQSVYQDYLTKINKFSSFDKKLSIIEDQIDELIRRIDKMKYDYLQLFYNQKIRFFPRISLMKINYIIDCLSWRTKEQIKTSILRFYEDVDDVIFDQNLSIKKIKIKNDFITFQKDILIFEENCSGLDNLKYFYINIQGIIEDSVSSSLNRTCHMKLICWYIYFTQQVETIFMSKNNFEDLKFRLLEIENQISQDLRYDLYSHHKQYQIAQLNLFRDLIQKLQKSQDPQNSYLWNSTIKMHQKLKKITVKQFQNTFEFGYEPKKYEIIMPTFFLQTTFNYGGIENFQSYQVSANITGQPLFKINLFQSVFYNKIHKLLDIISKWKYFAIIFYQGINQKEPKKQHQNDLALSYQLFQGIQLQKMRFEQRKQVNFILKSQIFNCLYKELTYFQQKKKQQINEAVFLPILICYESTIQIPFSLRSQCRTFNRPSKLFSLQIVVLIQLNKYQGFLSKFQISISKICQFFKEISETFAISYQKLMKILQKLQSFLRKLQTTSDFKRLSYINQKDNTKNTQPLLSSQKQSKNNISSSQFSSSSSEDSERQEPNNSQIQDLKNNKNKGHPCLKQTPIPIPSRFCKSQRIELLQQNKIQTSAMIVEQINKELFKYLLQFFPEKELQISQLLKSLLDIQTNTKQDHTQIQENIINLKNGGKNIIIYGQMSQKTTLIKKYFKYGKNVIKRQLNVKEKDNQIQNNRQQKNQQNYEEINIFYLQGLDSYDILKKSQCKFLLQSRTIHSIKPSFLTQTLIYVHPLKISNIKTFFQTKLIQIFQKTKNETLCNKFLKEDFWTIIQDFQQIYEQCRGIIYIVNKIQIILNVFTKELAYVSDDKIKKKLDSKMLVKQFAIIVFEIYYYSMDLQDRQKMIELAKDKKYLNFKSFKGLNIQDLMKYTSINLQTEKLDYLIKREKFIKKNMFPISKEITIIRKYLKICFQQGQSKSILSNFSSTHKINFLFSVENYHLKQVLKEYFQNQVKDMIKPIFYFPNNKLILACMKQQKKDMNNLNKLEKCKIRRAYVIEDLHLATEENHLLLKICTQHMQNSNQYSTYLLITQKNRTKQQHLHFKQSIVINLPNCELQMIFKTQSKAGINENIIQKIKNLQGLQQFLDPNHYLSFVLNCQVNLPAQVYEKFIALTFVIQQLTPRKLQLLRNKTQFKRYLDKTINNIENTLKTNYQSTYLVKSKTFVQIHEIQINKHIQKFLINQRFQFLERYIIKNHIKNLLHLTFSDKIYIIQEEVTILPYLISFIQNRQVFVFDDSQNFVYQFLKVIQNFLIKSSNKKQLSSQVSILIKYPFSNSPKFKYFVELVTKKVDFLNIYQQFQTFFKIQKEKQQFIFQFRSQNENNFQKIIKFILNNCKWFICLHKTDKFDVNHEQLVVVKTQKINQKKKANPNLRKSIIDRQLGVQKRLSHKINKIDQNLAYNSQIQLYDNMVYLNLTLSKQEKIRMSKQIIENQEQKLFQIQNETNIESGSSRAIKSKSKRLDKTKNINTEEYSQVEIIQNNNQSKIIIIVDIIQNILDQVQISAIQMQSLIKKIYECLNQNRINYYNLSKKDNFKDFKQQKEDQFNITQLKLKPHPKIQEIFAKIKNRKDQITKIVQKKQMIVQFYTKTITDKKNQEDLQIVTQKSINYSEVFSQQYVQSQGTKPHKKIDKLQYKYSKFFNIQTYKKLKSIKDEYWKYDVLIEKEKIQKMKKDYQNFTSQNKDQSNHDSFQFFKPFFQNKQFQGFSMLVNDQFIVKSFGVKMAQTLLKWKSKYHAYLKNEQKKKRSRDKLLLDEESNESEQEKKQSILTSSKDGKQKTAHMLSNSATKKNLKEKRNSNKSKNSRLKAKQSIKLQADEIQQDKKQQEISLPFLRQQRITKLLIHSTQQLNQQMLYNSDITELDIVLHRHVSQACEIYQIYLQAQRQLQYPHKNSQFQATINNENQHERVIDSNLVQMLEKEFQIMQYFLYLDLVSLQKNYLQIYKENYLQITQKQQLIQKYIQIFRCSESISNQTQKSNKSLLTKQDKTNIYECIYIEVLSGLEYNQALNDKIKRILQIQCENSYSSLKNLSKKSINLTDTELIETKFFSNFALFLVYDPYHELHNILNRTSADSIFYTDYENINIIIFWNQLKQLRFKPIYYCFYFQTISEFLSQKLFIEEIITFLKCKNLDSKSAHEKIVLIFQNENQMYSANLHYEQSITVKLNYTYLKFNQQINMKQIRFTRQQSQNMMESYSNLFNLLAVFSNNLHQLQNEEIILQKIKVQQKDLQRFLELTKNLQQFLETKNNRKMIQQGQCLIVYQYLKKLLDDHIVPYRFLKRIYKKIDWPKMEQFIRTYSKPRRRAMNQKNNIPQNKINVPQNKIKNQIKQWLGKQLLAFQRQNFVQQLKECIGVSNSIVLVYETLSQNIFSQIKIISQSESIDFKFYFQFPNLKKRQFLQNLDDGIQTDSLQQNISESDHNKKLSSAYLENQLIKNSYNSMQTVSNLSQRIKAQQTNHRNKLMTRNKLLRVEEQFEQDQQKANYYKKKNLYFVHQRQLDKVKQVLHICSVIWV